ncbi:hypothetical protein H6P81_012217 [Aristolochia fimbriata]|uniref:C2 domain-containing protein n=1 Tax=Aristolochia fimbriata TaxID=158543 RepID=A0AAV7EBK2_ARIFI|nr:hypothetical protein H6P81_012217 [Aristolochia fimbriata]
MPLPPEPAPVFHLLEINVISAQDLYEVGSRMHTYAVAWVHPNRKLSTRVDPDGHTSPTWNDKFVFRIDEEFLRSYTSAIMIEIYCLRFFRDTHVGTVRVLLSNLLPLQTFSAATPRHIPTRFVALQVRRPSGRPQGIINVGVALLDGSMRSMPLYSQLNASALGYRDLMGGDDSGRQQQQQQPSHQSHKPTNAVPHLRRTKSDITSDIGEDKPPLSTIEVSELIPPKATSSVWSDSDLGPPPSVVAAKVAHQVQKVAHEESFEVGSSVLEDWSVASSKEDLKAKLERWKTELPPIYDAGYGSVRSEETVVQNNRHNRRKTDGGGGLFSCFGDSYGCECSFFCGMSPRKSGGTATATTAAAASASTRKLHVVASDPNINLNRRSLSVE